MAFRVTRGILIERVSLILSFSLFSPYDIIYNWSQWSLFPRIPMNSHIWRSHKETKVHARRGTAGNSCVDESQRFLLIFSDCSTIWPFRQLIGLRRTTRSYLALTTGTPSCGPSSPRLLTNRPTGSPGSSSYDSTALPSTSNGPRTGSDLLAHLEANACQFAHTRLRMTGW